jgi:hypothetical protein
MASSRLVRRWLVAAILLVPAGAALAQTPPDPNALIDAQRAAMKPLARMDGVWRGRATTMLPGGDQRTITQTERIGPFLGGTVKVIEGRGYDANGTVVFNALGIISFDPATQKHSMRSYALGRQGDFAVRPTDDGYSCTKSATASLAARRRCASSRCSSSASATRSGRNSEPCCRDRPTRMRRCRSQAPRLLSPSTHATEQRTER